ncbi:uncharacterized protein LOC121492110 isoform X2 [Vulpes lagopus]|uniref:uncharacterized protein LOC121492110 isoform X2 n=1 Tax=Vulpes lagopus TaxID=494514 RepID=UPI001BC9377D|nr:uncharacterized protein LOC121492110 isoform X2 [Vulpes lagopus]
MRRCTSRRWKVRGRFLWSRHFLECSPDIAQRWNGLSSRTSPVGRFIPFLQQNLHPDLGAAATKQAWKVQALGPGSGRPATAAAWCRPGWSFLLHPAVSLCQAAEMNLNPHQTKQTYLLRDGILCHLPSKVQRLISLSMIPSRMVSESKTSWDFTYVASNCTTHPCFEPTNVQEKPHGNARDFVSPRKDSRRLCTHLAACSKATRGSSLQREGQSPVLAFF